MEKQVLDLFGETLMLEVSDGLAGELYTEDGWISRFSERSAL